MYHSTLGVRVIKKKKNPKPGTDLHGCRSLQVRPDSWKSRSTSATSTEPGTSPLSSEYGTHKTVTAGFWPWPSRPATSTPVRCSGFRVSGFGFRVSGIGYWVSGFGFRVSGFGFRVSGFGYRVSGIGHRVSGFGFRDLGFRVQGFRVSGFGFGVPHYGFRMWGLGFRG